jgi:hypothetical protein
MPSQLKLLRIAATVLRAGLAELRREGDAGYTTETVVVVALLVAMAVAGQPADTGGPGGAGQTPGEGEAC